MTKSRRASWIALVIGASVTVFWLAISARYLESAFGWDAVNYAVIAPVLVAFLATSWLRLARRPEAAAD